MPRAPRPTSPLPLRDGLGASRLVLPRNGQWSTVLAYLVARFPDDGARLREKVFAGEVVDAAGVAVDAATPYVAGATVHLYRDPPDEVVVPFAVEVLHRDDDLLVVDKPHFLATTPRGAHVAQTVLARLRRELDLPELSPAHRLDRLTAGVLVLTVRREVRGAYQRLFQARAVHKEYEAIAGHHAEVALPTTVRSRIVKLPGHLAAQEVPGPVNAVTEVGLIEVRDGVGRYLCRPLTGQTHQLRVHLASLGLPILGDPLLPVIRTVDGDDFTDPLQLLARSLAFADPFTGERREFRSTRTLAGWPR